MKNKLALILLVFASMNLRAQVPQFYNSAVSGVTNNYPLSSATFNKAQWIFGPNHFNASGTGIGAAAYFGNISKIFLKLGNAVNPSSQYTNITISLSQNVGTSTSFGTDTAVGYNFVTGMSPCFYQASGYTLTGAVVNSWYGFDLTGGSFPYNPNLSLVVEIKVSGGLGNRISLMGTAAPARLYGAYNGTVGTTATGSPNFGINMIPTPLPALVTNFFGVKENTFDKLEWSTGNELNNAYFNLQHATDGIHFTTIEKIQSKALNGNSSSTLNYEAINPKPFNGHNYYRLEQVNIDGTPSMNTKVVDLIRSSENQITMYPNPVGEELKFKLYQAKVSNISIKIYDIRGRIVRQVKTTLQSGFNEIPLQVKDLKSGMYQVRVYENDKVIFDEKLSKE